MTEPETDIVEKMMEFNKTAKQESTGSLTNILQKACDIDRNQNLYDKKGQFKLLVPEAPDARLKKVGRPQSAFVSTGRRKLNKSKNKLEQQGPIVS
jgi:hypothetical protein